jgi:hydrogenase maturation protein HypF
MKKAFHIHAYGRIQGVGFRPFIYRIAYNYGLTGWVLNTNRGVTMEVEGPEESLTSFLSAFRTEIPAAARIDKLLTREMPLQGYIDFRILPSKDISDEVTEICPDIPVCRDCLDDIEHQERRKQYGLVNCAHCGPRFSIIRALPYDRFNTTMQEFPMCPECKREYENVLDRRFHAQPVACNICGPKYRLWAKHDLISDNLDTITAAISTLITEGRIIAFKGIGGFHLACDAFNSAAISELRRRKQRESKPFAVMFRNILSLKLHAEINKIEEGALASWSRPIVLLEQKDTPEGTSPLAKELNQGLDTIGAMLPYMPIHYLLFRKLETDAIVLTSGNVSEEPIITSNTAAQYFFTDIADAVVDHEREIYNRSDDSVLRVVLDKPRILRRSRGFVPESIRLATAVEGIVACGAELMNCFCIGKGNSAILSQHIGDLKNQATLEFYSESMKRFTELFRITTSLIVHDLHPEYLSSRYARDFKKNNPSVDILAVQHHHAHVAACMAEHELDGPVLGIAMDGTGLGTDGQIWGSEFLLCDLNSFERLCHFDYLPLPGGDKAIKEPWRTAIAALYLSFGKKTDIPDIPALKVVGKEKKRLVLEMLDRNVNCPLSCGAGRYFDAVSALLGICLQSEYEGEAPMKLEALADNSVQDEYPFRTGTTVDFKDVFRMIAEDLFNGRPPEYISARFHNTVISAIFEVAIRISKEKHLKKIVLSGGMFQNKFILEKLAYRFIKSGIKVFVHEKVPPNDGGIALGQLVIASAWRKRNER